MNKCWKFQGNILILVLARGKRLKICCNQWTPFGHQVTKCPNGVHWLQQIFSHLALNQKWIEISAWNFQHLFITCLCKFDQKILAIAQSACQPLPILKPILMLIKYVWSEGCWYFGVTLGLSLTIVNEKCQISHSMASQTLPPPGRSYQIWSPGWIMISMNICDVSDLVRYCRTADTSLGLTTVRALTDI